MPINIGIKRMDTKQYQAGLVTKFKEIFHSDEVKSEWSAFKQGAIRDRS
ncbi:MAG: hypothetical protein BWY26_00222 [Elusimicrobia bacterium ADurb.Bin231]|nr:MAG: hypothetical protein BWY26_00222 [Elusimicrobia bacterium ADurb.Bin231]